MRIVTVVDRQNIIDAAVQFYGSAAAVIDLCIDNNLELDSDIMPGQQLLLQDTYPESGDSDVADYIQGNKIVVVSFNEDDPAALGDNNNEFIITNSNNYIGA